MNRRNFALSVVLGISAAWSVAPNASAAVGRTAGNFSVSPTGGANYTIPIWVPPGPRGVQPRLTLVYSSHGGDGIVGPGWGLAGLSSITRCNRTYAQDPAPSAVTLATSDGYCLDGNRLRLTGGTYGVAGSTYQTELANFSLITAQGSAGNGPEHFIVKGKDGLTYEYGKTADSRILGGTTAMQWLLNRAEDRAGNNYVVAYGTGAAGSSNIGVPQSISYTPISAGSSTYRYSVTFTYGQKVAQVPSTTDPAIVGFVAGIPVVNTNLLLNISVLHSGTLVRKYTLGYGASPTTTRARLTSITECAGSAGTDCLSPTAIGYQDGSAGVTTSSVSAGAGTFVAARDFTGDGREDILALGTGLTAAVSSGGGFGSPVTVAASYSSGALLVAYDDVATKGQTDILAPQSGSWTRYTWNGSSFTSTATGIALAANANRAALTDVDGDGRPDLVVITKVLTTVGGTKTFTVTARTRLNTSSAGGYTFGSETVAYTTTLACMLSDGQCSLDVLTGAEAKSALRSLDFNGDGRKDLARVSRKTVAGEIVLTATPVVSTGSTFTESGGYSPDGLTIAGFANWNNDACTDIVTPGSVTVSPCNAAAASFISFSGTALTTMDWDGNGRTDLLVQNGANFAVYKSTGTGATSLITTSVPVSTTSASNAFVFDQNGDGLHDLGTWSTSGIVFYAHTGANTPADLVTSITDGYGINASPAYVSIVASNYTKGTGAQYPERDGQLPLYVVNQVTASDGIGSTHLQTFSYAGGRWNVQGRGFEGFQSQTVLDDRNGLIQKTYFHSEFPLTGAIYQEDLFQPNGTTLISHASITNDSERLDVTATEARYFAFVEDSSVEERELDGPKNGQLITTTEKDFTYDDYGNATLVVTTVTDEDATSPYNGLAWTTTTTATITPVTTSDWCLNIPSQITVTNTAPGVSAITRTIGFTPDYAECRVTQKVAEPSSATYAVTEAYGFDAFGNVNSTTVTGASMASRQTLVNWGTTGQLPMSVTNPLAQQTQLAYDFSLGVQQSITDPNAVSRSWQYDAFGRRTREDRPDLTATTWAYNDCTSAGCVNSNNKMTVVETVLNVGGATNTERRTYLDRMDRTLVTSTRLLGSDFDRSEVQYDDLGRVAQQSMPSVSGSGSIYWINHDYDALNRLISTDRPINDTNGTLQTTTIQYAGRTTTTTDPQGKQSVKIVTVAGTLGRSQDHNAYYQNFTYDAFGSLLSVTDSLSNPLFTATYDYGIGAFQRTASDMDLGARSNTFNALGELTASSDAKSQNFSFTYDALSRPLTRTEPDLTTTWTWGTSAASHNIGSLQSVSANTYSEAYSYDNQGRLVTRSITIPSDATYSYDYAYSSSTGLLDTLTYPTSTSSYRLKLQYMYENGLLKQVADFNTPFTVFWQANATNARGQVTQETLGNGVVTNRAFDAVTGWMESLQSGVSGGGALQNESYLFDLVGNVTQRQNNNVGLTENFFYDNLYRLDSSNLGGTQNLDLSYDATGNITLRSDVASGATWTYHASKKHAVTQAGSAAYTYSYDPNGNVTSRGGYSVDWTSYNHPSLINGASGESVAFAYNHNHERFRAILTTATGIETTYFVGEHLEKVVTAGASDYRHYIFAGGTKVAVYSRTSGGTNTLRYIREDHQGSIASILNSNGTSYVKESFTAFGNRRSSCTWSGAPTSGQLSKINIATRRGYTWHTALGSMGLNDMNGRIQDAVTGRFLSPDPFVQAPQDTQSFNRYTYVFNNPLSFTDPNGFDAKYIRQPDSVGFAGDTVTITGSRFSGVTTSGSTAAVGRAGRQNGAAEGGGGGGHGSAESPDDEVTVTGTRPKKTPPNAVPANLIAVSITSSKQGFCIPDVMIEGIAGAAGGAVGGAIPGLLAGQPQLAIAGAALGAVGGGVGGALGAMANTTGRAYGAATMAGAVSAATSIGGGSVTAGAYGGALGYSISSTMQSNGYSSNFSNFVGTSAGSAVASGGAAFLVGQSLGMGTYVGTVAGATGAATAIAVSRYLHLINDNFGNCAQ